jgi:two-component system NtrC family sensor kinase
MTFIADIIQEIFSYEKYMPHGYCLLWQPGLIWMHIVSDITIMLAYYSIPITILYLTRKQKIPFQWVFMLFALFIFLCGTTHLVGIITLWYPMYYFEGLLKVLTAAASIATALFIFPLVPTLLEQFKSGRRDG